MAATPLTRLPGRSARKGEHRLDLGVLRKGLGVGQIDGATGRVQLELPLPPLRDLVHDPARVAHEELGGVHQHALTGAGHDVEPPVHRRREGIAHGPRLRGVVGDGPELVVGLDQQHPRPDALRLEYVRPAQLPPVNAHRIAPEPRPHRDLVEELGVQVGDLPVKGAGVVIPVEVEEALHLGRALGVVLDGGEGLGGEGRGGGGCERGRGGDGHGEEGGLREDASYLHGGYLGGGCGRLWRAGPATAACRAVSATAGHDKPDTERLEGWEEGRKRTLSAAFLSRLIAYPASLAPAPVRLETNRRIGHTQAMIVTLNANGKPKMATGSNSGEGGVRQVDHAGLLPPRHDLFLSFASEHKDLVDLFLGRARHRLSMLSFSDSSMSGVEERAWQFHVERLIRSCSATLCLVGDTTYKSEPVNWEIRMSVALGKRVLAAYLQPTTLFPAALLEIGITPSPLDIDLVMDQLNAR